jgi:hypothetical protein
MMKGLITMIKNLTPFAARKKLASEIRELSKNLATNTIALGQKLKDARDTFQPVKGRGAQFSRPGWSQWYKKETGLSQASVYNLILIADKFASTRVDSWKAGNKILGFLARPSTPEKARQEIIGRLDKGETVTAREAEAIAERVRAGQGITKKEIGKVSAFFGGDKNLPKPQQAKAEARKTGTLVLASDGYYYTPATDEQLATGKKQTQIVFGVKRAVEMLCSVDMTPHQFLDYAPDFLLWTDKNERDDVAKAAKWLSALAAAWEMRADKITAQIEQRAEERSVS